MIRMRNLFTGVFTILHALSNRKFLFMKQKQNLRVELVNTATLCVSKFIAWNLCCNRKHNESAASTDTMYVTSAKAYP
jgi:hypothetical protein